MPEQNETQQEQPTIEQLRAQIEEKDRLIADLERRQRIDALLHESEAIDVEAARLLTELAVAQMNEPDVEQAVAELKRRKPLLFRPRMGSGSGAMSERVDGRSGRDESLNDAAAKAGASGARTDLLRYLRLKRR